MKSTKILLILLLLTLFAQAGNERSIYRKEHGKEKKVALVIGNKNYTHFNRLKNTLHDAEDMRDILSAEGFDVLYLPDGDLKQMEKIVRKFSYKLKQGGVGFFYYSGHGLEVDGQNYLIPVDADIPEENEVKYQSLAMNMVVDKMRESRNRLNIIVLDACRSNPFGRDGGGGLAQINHAKGMYIAFATAPNEVASDGVSGRNGLFTRYLITNIKTPNLTLNQVFKRTRASVYWESGEKQLPWTSSSVIGDFYFRLEPLSGSDMAGASDIQTHTADVEKKRKGITRIDGKMWQNPPSQKRFTWDKAVAYCEELTLGGYDDWRLPDRDELRGLGNRELYRYKSYDGWEKWFESHKGERLKNAKGDFHFIRREFLEGMPTLSWFWSSSIYKNDSSNAWFVYFKYGNVYWSNLTDEFYVLCVRGQ